MLLAIIKMLRTLIGYVIIGLPAIILLGWLIPKIDIKNRNYAFNVWYALDVAICAIAHNTYKRTISGWTGQHMSNKLRYKYQARVIDWLMKNVDGHNHCVRAYHHELIKGYV